MNSFILREEDYAIRIMIFMASVKNKVKIQDICKCLYLSHPITVKIVNRLKSCGFVETKTGRNGGLTISEKALESSLYDILSCMDFDSRVNSCQSQNTSCQLFPICKANRFFSGLQKDVEDKLKEAKIKEFLFNTDEMCSKLKMQEV